MSENNNKEKGNAFEPIWQKKNSSGPSAGQRSDSQSQDTSSERDGLSIYTAEAGFSKDAPQDLLLERIKKAAGAIFGANGGELTRLADELEKRAAAIPSYGQGMSGAPYGQGMNGTPYGQGMYGQGMSGAPYGQGMYGQSMNGAPYGQGMYGQGMNGAPYGRGMYGQSMFSGARNTGGSLAERWQNEARQLKLVVPEFDLKQALSDSAFTDALSKGRSVFEAYAESMRMPKNEQRSAVYQNGQSARRGTGEATLNPADMSQEDFKRYIEKLKEQ